MTSVRKRNLIVGGRNGGEAGYLELVDDVAVWNQVLTARQIKSIAGGQSPINAEQLTMTRTEFLTDSARSCRPPQTSVVAEQVTRS